MDRTGVRVWMVLVAAATAAACGAPKGTNAKSPSAAGATGSVCKASSAARPIGNTGSSSTVALARVGDARVAYVADEDAKAILTVDLETRVQIAETPLGAAPGQVYVARDGRVFATLRDKNEIAVFAASRADAPLSRLCSAPTPPEPIAMAATPDEATLLVTTGWGQRLAAYDAATLKARYQARLPREPRSVVVSDDGKTAFVSHAAGSVVSAVDLGSEHAAKSISLRGYALGELQALTTQKKEIARLKASGSADDDDVASLEEEVKRIGTGRPSCQGFALVKSAEVTNRIFAPQVLVDPGDPEQRPDGYGDESTQTETPAVAVIDEGAAEPLPSSLTVSQDLSMFSKRGRDQRDPRPECLLPRAAAVDAKTKSLLVTCYGIDAVIAYDALSANPLTSERKRWTVGSGPSGIAVDPDKHRAVVWSQFDRTLSTFSIGSNELVDDKVVPQRVQRTAMAPLTHKLPAEYALGRILFHAAGDLRISADGRACASCHPDGRDDAITWATPEGPRRSILLAGRAVKTPPYSWNGNERTLHNHLGNTFDRLSGKGLRSIELDALVTYLSSMPAPPANAEGDKAKIERGRAIFASKEAACSSCHSGPTFTDGRNHDVGSKHAADRGAAFNTPSLHLVGGAGPYFHDGRYATLTELLRRTDGTMGHTKHLSDADLDALETYVRSL